MFMEKNPTIKQEKITKLLDPRKKTINFKLNAKLNKKRNRNWTKTYEQQSFKNFDTN